MKKGGAKLLNPVRSKSFIDVMEKKFSKKAVRAGGEFALTLVKEAVSTPAVSNRELAARDHPFARRHGGVSNTPYPKEYSIGSSSGRVKKAIKGRMLNQYAYRIKVDESSPHVLRLIQGTRIMLPRDILRGVLGDPKVHKMVFKKMKDAIKK